MTTRTWQQRFSELAEEQSRAFARADVSGETQELDQTMRELANFFEQWRQAGCPKHSALMDVESPTE